MRDITLMRKIQKLALILFVVGGAIIGFGLLLEVFDLLQSAWPSILFGLGCIAISVFLDGHEGSRLS